MTRPMNCIMLNNEIIKHLVFKEYLRYNDISRHIVKWKQRNHEYFDFTHTHTHTHTHTYTLYSRRNATIIEQNEMRKF